MTGRHRNPRAEEIRIRHRYRRLVLSGCLRLPPEAAAALIGPDCAYRLYSLPAGGGSPPEDPPAGVGGDRRRGPGQP